MLSITLSEILIWVVWLWIAHQPWGGQAFAAAILMVLMLIEHSVEMAILRGNTRVLFYLKNKKTIFFTVMEVLGAVGWLYYVRQGQPMIGGGILFLGLSIEHIIQGSALKPEPGE